MPYSGCAGAVWGFLAISMGAFRAHGLEDRFASVGGMPGGLSAERLKANFNTAAQYHMYCAGHPGGGYPGAVWAWRRSVSRGGMAFSDWLTRLFGESVCACRHWSAVAGGDHADWWSGHDRGLGGAGGGCWVVWFSFEAMSGNFLK